MDYNIEIFGDALELGEGPLWHPLRNQLFWFNIPTGTLYCSNAKGELQSKWNFNEAASAAGWIDSDTLLVATASGLKKFDIATGEHSHIIDMESQNPKTRSNDGRVAFDGSFWIGTMGYECEPKLGSYYRYASDESGGELKKLLSDITVPNATCFSPDGKFAYLSDTRQQVIWRWQLDSSGVPEGNKEVHIDLRQDNLNPDGAVCDSQGYLWNTQYGSSRIARYAPDGSFDMAIELPVSQPTCPAFGGDDLRILYITSAAQHLSEVELQQQPDAGRMLRIELDIAGLRENQVYMFK